MIQPLGRHRHQPRAPTAYHEAGHTLLATSLGLTVESATVIPAGGWAGMTRYRLVAGLDLPDEGLQRPVLPDTGTFPENYVVVRLWCIAVDCAGWAAERLATGYAEEGFYLEGCDLDTLADAAADVLDATGAPREWGHYLRDGVRRAVDQHLRSRWGIIEKLTAALLEAGTLSGADVDRLLAGFDLAGPDLRSMINLSRWWWWRNSGRRARVPA